MHEDFAEAAQDSMRVVEEPPPPKPKPAAPIIAKAEPIRAPEPASLSDADAELLRIACSTQPVPPDQLDRALELVASHGGRDCVPLK